MKYKNAPVGTFCPQFTAVLPVGLPVLQASALAKLQDINIDHLLRLVIIFFPFDKPPWTTSVSQYGSCSD